MSNNLLHTFWIKLVKDGNDDRPMVMAAMNTTAQVEWFYQSGDLIAFDAHLIEKKVQLASLANSP